MNSLQRDKPQENSQSREMDGLDSKYLKRQALREPSEERYHDQRSEKCDCDERFQNLQGT